MSSEILLLFAGLYLAWTLGANDATNMISMLVGAKAASYWWALLFLGVCSAFGFFFLSGEVMKTVSGGVVESSVISSWHAGVALLVAAVWVHFATWKKWPVSISQSVVSSVLGMGLVESFRMGEMMVHWAKVGVLAGVWLLSPLAGFALGWLLFKIFHGMIRHKHLYLRDAVKELVQDPFQVIHDWVSGHREKREKWLHAILLASSGYMAVALGANTIAAEAALVVSGGSWNVMWLEIAILSAVFLGVVMLGHELVDFMGRRILKLDALRGASIQVAAATVTLVSALLGYPLSTTGVFVGAFLGVEFGEKHPNVQRHGVRSLKYSFFVTIPVVMVCSAVVTWFVF